MGGQRMKLTRKIFSIFICLILSFAFASFSFTNRTQATTNIKWNHITPQSPPLTNNDGCSASSGGSFYSWDGNYLHGMTSFADLVETKSDGSKIIHFFQFMPGSAFGDGYAMQGWSTNYYAKGAIIGLPTAVDSAFLKKATLILRQVVCGMVDFFFIRRMIFSKPTTTTVHTITKGNFMQGRTIPTMLETTILEKPELFDGTVVLAGPIYGTKQAPTALLYLAPMAAILNKTIEEFPVENISLFPTTEACISPHLKIATATHITIHPALITIVLPTGI